jgi:hypothetical protein
MNRRGYACEKTSVLTWLLLMLAGISGTAMAETWYGFPTGDRVLRYSLKPTGTNFTFQFEENPGNLDARLKAGWHVLQTAYQDDSIARRQRSFFAKEGAKCFVYDAWFHTYTTCFLPNDYSPGNEERFWGYVTRVPNGYWLITRNLVPAVLVLGLFLWWMRRPPKAQSASVGVNGTGSYRPVR